MFLGAALLGAGPSPAQITLDGTLGRPALALTGPNYTIGANVGRLAGGNLFHSFSRFNVNTGQSATFTGPVTVTNVIGRVTGPEASSIDGVLRSSITGANLYLINPNGLVFGPNASLDVSGSFHASTAHYLKLGSDGRFDAVMPSASVLKSAPPSAFGFIGPPSPITVNGSLLAVPTGKTLSLTGGDLLLSGTGLVARGGRVGLASVGAAGDVAFTTGGIIATSPAPFGAISMSDSFVDARSAVGAPSEGIHIRAGRLTQNGSSLIASTTGAENAGDITVGVERLSLLNGSGLVATSSSAGRGGDVSIEAAESVTMSGLNSFGNRSGVFVSSNGAGASGTVDISTPELVMATGMIATFGSGTGGSGSVDLRVGRLEMTAGARVDASTAGVARGGDITVSATESIAISGEGGSFKSGLVNNSNSSGPAGPIRVFAPELSIDLGLIASQAGGSGRGGDIEINVGRLALTGGGRIDASTFGPGPAGNLNMTATDSIQIAGRNAGGLKSGLLSIGGAGAAGSIFVATPRLVMDDGLVASFTDGNGDAGNIALRSGRMTLSNNASVFASTSGDGNAGDIDIRTDRLAMSGSSQVLAITDGAGRAGNISVSASESIRITGIPGAPLATLISSLSRSAGDAGNVAVSAPAITLSDGHINSESGSTGRAGDITISSGRLSLLDGAQISSTTFGAGRGGDITVSATDSVTLAGRDIGGSRSGLFSNAQGTIGNAGSISVSTPVLQLNGGLIGSSTFSDGNADAVDLNVGRLVVRAGGSVAADNGIFGTGATGNVTIVASESVTVSGQDEISPSSLSTTTSNAREGGTVTISAPLVRVEAGGVIESSSSGGGRAGNILINAGRLSIAHGGKVSSGTQNGLGGLVHVSAGSIDISGGEATADSTGIFTTAELLAQQAGEIEINAPLVTIERGAISSAGSGLFGSNAGSVSLQVGRLALSNGASIDTSASANVGVGGGGAGGQISIVAGDVTLDASRIRAENLGTGDAGDIQVRASNALRLANSSSISTQAAQGDGGNITITVGNLVHLRNGSITTSVGAADGNGGNITIDPIFVILDNSRITANAVGGDGGNISIVSQFFIANTGSLVEASSEFGLQGEITLTAPNVDVSAGLAALPSGFFDASLLLRESCAARASRAASSSFTGIGRGGLPVTPGQMAFGSYYSADAAASADTGFTLASARMPDCR